MHPQVINGLFDELEKMGGIVSKVLADAANHPVKYLGRAKTWDDSKKNDFNDAIKRGYPAGWVALGMRPNQ